MDSFNVKLDQSHYKGLILGTGMYESLISSALAYKGHSSLNLDQDASYSAAIKTCSVKEFMQLFSNVYPDKKNHIFRIANYETTISEEEKSKLRGFNIDLQPRFLYSSSLTVNKMVEAGMDKYMDFRAISGVFFFDNDSSKFLKVPINKGEIFSSPALSLIEKRKLFKFLHACTTLSKVLNDSETDINSTAEFDKDLKIDESLVKNVLEIKGEHVNKFMDLMGISGKLANLLVYVIANVAYNIEDTKKDGYFLTTQGFITRVEKFIKSMGIHSNYPYLYTNYGTSDIPQGFSRASAVNGSIFILHPQMNFEGITRAEEHAEEAKVNFKLKTNLAEGKDHVTSELLVINKDYINLLDGFQEGDISFEEKALLRITILVEDTQKNITTDTPSFYYAFPNTKALGNPSPVFIFATGEKSNSTPANHFIFYVQTVVDEKTIMENIKTLEKNLRDFIREQLCGNSEYRELASAAYVQVRRNFAKESQLTEKGGLVIIDDDNYSLDFDDYFAHANDYMKRLCPENDQLLFQPNGDKKAEENHFAQPADDDDYDGDNHLNNLLQTLDKFKVENTTQNTAAQETVQEGNAQEGAVVNENAGSSAAEQEIKEEENK